MFLASGDGHVRELLVLHHWFQGPFDTQVGRWDFSRDSHWKMDSPVEGRISWFFLSCGRNLGVPLKLQRELQGPTRIGSGKSSLHASCEGPLGIPLQLMLGLRSSSGVEAGTSGLLSSADMIFGFLWSFNGGVKPRLV